MVKRGRMTRFIFTDGNGAAKNLSEAPSSWQRQLDRGMPATSCLQLQTAAMISIHVRRLAQYCSALRRRTFPLWGMRRDGAAIGDLIEGLPWRRLTMPLSAR
jgi:hypothetical protein